MTILKTKPRWEDIPDWVNVILKQKDHSGEDRYVYAESLKDNSRAAPCMTSKDHFTLIADCWELVEERPQKDNQTSDQVRNPKHYQLYNLETIEVIRDSMTNEEWLGYCKGNSLKYRLRAGKKDPVEQDIAKAMYYEELYEKYKDGIK